MIIRLWGTRGSMPCPGPDTIRYGGNTSCVEVTGQDGTLLILDAGTGIRRLGDAKVGNVKRVDIFLTHLHLDHILGLGLFAPLYDDTVEVHIYGPASSAQDLHERLTRYLSPPLFPVLLRDLPCKLELHEVPGKDYQVGPFQIVSDYICHPGPTVGYRIQSPQATIAYIPDHEPALGTRDFSISKDWISGFHIAANVDLLLHDAQYSQDEYNDRIGWGHSSINQTIEFGTIAAIKKLVPFHHDPSHSDEFIDAMIAQAIASNRPPFIVQPGQEGSTFDFTRHHAD